MKLESQLGYTPTTYFLAEMRGILTELRGVLRQSKGIWLISDVEE